MTDADPIRAAIREYVRARALGRLLVLAGGAAVGVLSFVAGYVFHG